MYFPSAPETLMKVTTYDLRMIFVQSLSDTGRLKKPEFSQHESNLLYY